MQDNVIVGGDLNVLRPKVQNGKYLSYLLSNKKRLVIAKYAQGDSIVHLYGEKIKNININLPTFAEQEKVSNLLELLNKKIELQQKQIEALKIYKKGLIQKLINQKNCPERSVSEFGTVITGTTPSKLNSTYWKIEALKIYKKGLIQKLINQKNCPERSVSEFGTVITGTTPSKLNSTYWNNGNIVWVTPSDITESKDIYTSYNMLTVDGVKAGRFIPAGSILVTCIASIGKNAILKVNGSCNQQINAIIPNKNFNTDYLYYLFEMNKYYLQSIAGTSATSIINKSSFENLVFRVPNIEQQNIVSKILNCLEHKIENEKFKSKNLNLFKKSLLQQMFI